MVVSEGMINEVFDLNGDSDVDDYNSDDDSLSQATVVDKSYVDANICPTSNPTRSVKLFEISRTYPL
ncbi:hypothetical protein AB6A40_008192 [Gnathostoma spinigerum]|uniref:Uncharacterized protein n=1 Tax=Gnathostoma spinigerum TaxID=75299 RepID=A0ABD6ENN8_9BILA